MIQRITITSTALCSSPGSSSINCMDNPQTLWWFLMDSQPEMEKRKKIAQTQIWTKKIAQKTRNSRQSTIRDKTA